MNYSITAHRPATVTWRLRNLNRAQLKDGYDIILVARGRTLTASWKELNDTFFRLCRKLDLLRNAP